MSLAQLISHRYLLREGGRSGGRKRDVLQSGTYHSLFVEHVLELLFVLRRCRWLPVHKLTEFPIEFQPRIHPQQRTAAVHVLPHKLEDMKLAVKRRACLPNL